MLLAFQRQVGPETAKYNSKENAETLETLESKAPARQRIHSTSRIAGLCLIVIKRHRISEER